jgi:type IV pilus assembly protein PilX
MINIKGRQSGAVLAVSLLLLLVLSILAVSMSQTARMQERMAGNVRDSDVAFQAAEAGLRGGEDFIDSSPTAPITCATPISQADCDVYEPGALETTDLRTDDTFWSASSYEYGVDGTDEIASAHEDPKYVVEFIEDIPDDDQLPPVITTRRYFYRVTSRAEGASPTAKAVIESTFAERF